MIIGFVDFIKFIFLIFFKNFKDNAKKLSNRNSLNNNNIFNKLICIESDDKETKKMLDIIKSDGDFLNSKPNIFEIIE